MLSRLCGWKFIYDCYVMLKYWFDRYWYWKFGRDIYVPTKELYSFFYGLKNIIWFITVLVTVDINVCGCIPPCGQQDGLYLI